MRIVPSQKCHDPRRPELTYHVTHLPQQSQMFDSKLDSGCYLQPENVKKQNKENDNLSIICNNNHLRTHQ